MREPEDDDQMNDERFTPFEPLTTTWPDVLLPQATVLVHPGGFGMTLLPETVPANACWEFPTFADTSPTTCPESLIAFPSDSVKPDGRGMSVQPNGLHTNALAVAPDAVPVTWPELLMPTMLTTLNPLGCWITCTE